MKRLLNLAGTVALGFTGSQMRFIILLRFYHNITRTIKAGCSRDPLLVSVRVYLRSRKNIKRAINSPRFCLYILPLIYWFFFELMMDWIEPLLM